MTENPHPPPSEKTITSPAHQITGKTNIINPEEKTQHYFEKDMSKNDVGDRQRRSPDTRQRAKEGTQYKREMDSRLPIFIRRPRSFIALQF